MDEVLSKITQNIDTLWVINCAILVFIMQAGFMCMESGLSRHKNSINVALKNAADFGVSVVMFWILGFGFMFGKSFNGFIGTDLFFFSTNISQYQTYFWLRGFTMQVKKLGPQRLNDSGCDPLFFLRS